MVRKAASLKNSLPAIVGVVAGIALTVLLGGAGVRPAAAQDANAVFQLQQQISNLQLSTQTRLDMMQAKVDNLERNFQSFQYEVRGANPPGVTLSTPTPNDPLPGNFTLGSLTSERSESNLFTLVGANGRLLAQVGNTSDGPGLVLFDPTGGISAALLATPNGPELRMRDASGELQTVLAGQ